MYPVKGNVEKNPLFYSLGGGVINKAYEVQEKPIENEEQDNIGNKLNKISMEPFNAETVNIRARFSGGDQDFYDDDENDEDDSVEYDDSDEIKKDEPQEKDEYDSESDEKDSDEKEGASVEAQGDDEKDENDYDAVYYDYDDDYDNKKRSNNKANILSLRDDELGFGEKMNDYNKPIEDEDRLATFNDDIRTSPLSLLPKRPSDDSTDSKNGVKKV